MTTSAGLREEISGAFQNAHYPGDDRIVSHECWECTEVTNAFKGTRWQDWIDRPPEDLCMRGGGIFLLSPEAFRYFLPAYLIVSLKDEKNHIQHQVLGALQRKADGFTPNQAKVIKKYLQFTALEDLNCLSQPEQIKPAIDVFEKIYPSGKTNAR